MGGSACRVDGGPPASGARRAPLPDSVVKRRKFVELKRMLGPTTGLRCLDLGSDNGVMSYLLRQGGGDWASADLDEEAVVSIRRLVGDGVHRLDGPRTPFATDEFDRVVVVDFLEHVHDDRAAVAEMFRILKPAGEVIFNVPHIRPGFLRWLRLALGDTDARHGHVRPGYTRSQLRALLDGRFRVLAERTYSKACSELVDIATRVVVQRLKSRSDGAKGVVLVAEDFQHHRRLFSLYALVRPVLTFLAALDSLLVWSEGHMLIVKAQSLKPASVAASATREEST